MSVFILFGLLFLAASMGWAAHAIVIFFTSRPMPAFELRARLHQMEAAVSALHRHNDRRKEPNPLSEGDSK